MTRRRRAVIALASGLVAGTAEAWVPLPRALRPDGPVAITVALAETAPADSTGDLNAAAVEAMALWNAKLQRVRLAAVPLEGEAWYVNGRSELFFDRRVFDKTWPSGVVAVTATTEDRGVVVETDIIFNASWRWSVYRGPPQSTPVDVRRVAVHELGHLLGLDHPDQAGQTVTAIMNSRVGAVEAPTADDEAGVRGLYDFGPGAAPVIVEQPKPASVTQGAVASLRVGVGGRGPLTYEWRRGGAVVAGANSNRYQFTAGLEDSGDYSVVVRSPAGAAVSELARIDVRAIRPPVLGALSVDTRTVSVTAGASPTLSVALHAGDAPLRFEWKRNGVSLGFTTGPTYVVQDAQFSDAGSYMVTASNAAGAATSLPSQLSVAAGAPPQFLAELAPASVAPGTAVSLSAAAQGSAPMSYQWKKDGIEVAGATGSTLQLSSFQSRDAGAYTLTASNSFGRATSPPIVTSLLGGATTLPAFVVTPSALNELVGATVGLEVTVEGADLGCRWFKDGVLLSDTPQPNVFGGLSIVGSRTAMLRLGRVQVSDSGTYTLEAANAFGTVTSRGITLSVLRSARPQIFSQPSPHSVTVGTTVGLTVSAGPVVENPNQAFSGADFTYQWFKDGRSLAVQSDPRLSFTAALSDNGRYFVRVTSDGGVTDSASVDVVVTTGPSPIITVHPATTYFTASGVEAIRLMPVAFEVFRRRAVRANGGIEDAVMVLVSASGSPVGGVTPGTYVMVATRADVTETSRPFLYTTLPPAPPSVVRSPDSRSADLNDTVELRFDVRSSTPGSFRWFKDGVAIDGALVGGSQFYIPRFSASHVGRYHATYTSPAGSVTSEAAMLELRSVGPPVITVHPLSQSIRSGETSTLRVKAIGGILGYQWAKDGFAVPGATAAQLDIVNVGAAQAGNYAVSVVNQSGTVRSRTAQVRVLLPERRPEIVFQPESQVAVLGGDVALVVGADGGPLPDRYQWRINGVDIPGAIDAKLKLRDVTAGAAGAYSVVVTNSAGSVTSRAATLTVDARGRLVNLATRAAVGRDGDILIAGFVIGGTESRQVLVRGIGDQLSEFGVSGVLRDPVVSLYDATGKLVDSNDDWFRLSEEKRTALEAAAKQVGAFAQRENARDGALLATLAPGSYTVKVAGLANTTGVGLVEVYELGKPGTGRLVNLSSRAVVGTGANILIPGLVLNGLTPRRLLIRAVGPGLAEFGVAATLADPVMTVLRGSEEVARNDNWGEQVGGAGAGAASVAQIRTTMAATGAFGLKEGSRDAVLLLDLSPGSYTVQVAGVAGATGVALVEVYEVGP